MKMLNSMLKRFKAYCGNCDTKIGLVEILSHDCTADLLLREVMNYVANDGMLIVFFPDRTDEIEITQDE